MKVENNLAINVQAIYEGLKHPQQLAIDHFHLAAVWRSNRSNLEDDYIVIVDEAHCFQSIKSSRTKAFLKLSEKEKCKQIWLHVTYCFNGLILFIYN